MGQVQKWFLIVLRVLLGLTLFNSGLIKVFGFGLQEPGGEGGQKIVGAFLEAMAANKPVWTLVGLAELMVGLTLISGFFMSLGIIVFAPLSLGILAFHLSMGQADGIGVGVLLVVLNLFFAWLHRAQYANLLKPSPSSSVVRSS